MNKEVKLEEIVEFVSGFAYPSSKFVIERNKDSIPIVRIQNVNSNENNFVYWNHDYKKQFIVNNGDILLSMSGDFKVIRWTKGMALLNQRVVKIIPGKNINEDYLLFLIDSKIRELTKLGKKSIINNLSIADLRSLKLVIPSYSQQVNLSANLSKCLDIINKRKSQIVALDKLIQSVFLEMFGNLKTNNKAWDVKEFDYFAKIDTKMTKDFQLYEELFHIGINNIEKNTGRIIDCIKVKDSHLISGKYIFNKKHIIYSKIRPYLNKVAMPEFEGLCSADAYPILVNDKVATKTYIAFLLRSETFLSHVSQNSSRTNIPKVNKNQIKSFKGVLPPLKLQILFEDKYREIEKQKAKLIDAQIEMQAFYNSLFQKAFQGELSYKK
ncbi:type I restriction endonuclease subunit S [Exiguobacterium sp. N4-1P]|uniref:restriction endonuclease subunit S n=1 Tax=Exiguobacterium sp. N4-1P TaxID=2051906 RepID=UPI000B59753B|nr:restriction endonuclease subunit S [Exiguobacterium sp. N4-1P]ASI34319.1 type I restriction endonuclease subunit S [Exiguobacterium sp. N4-1P]